ncbi:MAG: LysR family transcriptional regulator [Oleiphilaceae bacterium]|nr:LysR family transcriptional regulator [Oleiphilaceae bacterium]
MALPITLDALRVLDAIDRRGSFAAAADALHRVPSAVSYTVHKLEEDLDVALFDRSGHRATLTASGRYLLEQGRHLLDAAETLAHNTREVARGWESRLRVAVDTLLPMEATHRAIRAFMALQVPVELQLMEEVFAGSWDALNDRRCDLVLGVNLQQRPNSQMETRTLGQVPFVYAVAPDHPLARETQPLTEDQIRPYTAIVAADTSRQLRPGTAGIFSRQRTLTVGNMSQKIAAQVAGLGVGWLPRYRIGRELDEGVLVAMKVTPQREPVRVGMARWENHAGKAAEWFWQYCSAPGYFDQWLEPVSETESE